MSLPLAGIEVAAGAAGPNNLLGSDTHQLAQAWARGHEAWVMDTNQLLTAEQCIMSRMLKPDKHSCTCRVALAIHPSAPIDRRTGERFALTYCCGC